MKNNLILSVLAIAVMSACGNNTNTPAPANPAAPGTNPPASSVTVNIPVNAVGMGPAAYGVNPLVITPGTTVTWVNQASMLHSSTSDNGVWDSGVLSTGQNFSFRFNTPGTFPYHCSVHGAISMSGTIQVGPAPQPSISPSPTPTGSPIAATYRNVNAQVLAPACIGCHSTRNASAGLDFSSYSSVVHNSVRPNLVVPGKPLQSLLYADIQNGFAPGSSEALSQEQIQLVFDWIQNGALQN